VTTTATSASSTATTSRDPKHPLPFTGYEAWLVLGAGAGVAGAGIAIRRRVAG